MLAAAEGHLPLVTALLDCGARLSLRDEAGMTAAMIAQACRRPAVAIMLKAMVGSRIDKLREEAGGER